MAQYTRYEKLQKYYIDGTAVEPAEYKKGENLGVAEYSSLEECQNSSTPPTPPEPPTPGNYTCCIKWKAPALNFKFNNNDITTEENPWCTKEKVSSLDFHESKTNIESLDITVDETNNITRLNSAFAKMPYLTSVKLNIPKAASLRDISYMCAGHESLTSISFINFINFDTSHVTTANHVFDLCKYLTSLDVSNWDVSKVKYFANMFYRCDSLTHIKCKQAFKNWCITNQDKIGLPDAMCNGGTGTWTIVN